MNYIIRKAGPGLSAGELDALEGARPKTLRQEAPGVYVWLEDDSATTPAQRAETAMVGDVVDQWAAIADKARRAKDDATVALAETNIAKTKTHVAHHAKAATRGKRGAT